MNEREHGTSSASDRRDRLADASDWAADQRDMAANLRSWVREDDEFGQAYDQRSAEARDRDDARAERASAAEERSAQTVAEGDVEVRVYDMWCPGYLYAHDWRRSAEGRWQCLVHYSAPDPAQIGGR